jgi:hypothetical protein
MLFNALQHTKEKSYKLRVKLVDFSVTAQKEQLVYLAQGDMSMCKLMTNPTHSTIIGIRHFGMGKPSQSFIDVTRI